MIESSLLAQRALWMILPKRYFDEPHLGMRDYLIQMANVSPELFYHSLTAAKLAVKIGQHMGIDQAQLNEIRRGGQLHDVGKLAYPKLIRKIVLTEEETVLMRNHPTRGQEMLQDYILSDSIINMIVGFHQVWYNGDTPGYPAGFIGRDLPLAVRLFTVADAFAAMTDEFRPWQKKKTPRQALSELRANAGTQFDPDVVDVLVKDVFKGR